MKKITGPALLVAVLLLAACGSDDGETDSTAEETEVVAETTTDETVEDTAAAESGEGAAEDTEAAEETTTEGAPEDSTSNTEDVSEETAEVAADPAPTVDEALAVTGDGFIVTNQLSPTTEEQIAEFQQAGPDGPIYMVNLLEFKDFAEYEDGRETDLTGREAYALYADGMHDVLAMFGAEIVFEGDVSFLSIGQVEELWDEVGIVRYPSRATLLEMSASPEWMAVSVHRTAGLAGQLNIETVDAGIGS